MSKGGRIAESVGGINITEGVCSKGKTEGGIFNGCLVGDGVIKRRGVFCPMDRDGDLMGTVVGAGDGQEVSEAFRYIKLLNGSLKIIGTIAPVAYAVDGQFSIAAADRLGNKTCLPHIRISNEQNTGCF